MGKGVLALTQVSTGIANSDTPSCRPCLEESEQNRIPVEMHSPVPLPLASRTRFADRWHHQRSGPTAARSRFFEALPIGIAPVYVRAAEPYPLGGQTVVAPSLT